MLRSDRAFGIVVSATICSYSVFVGCLQPTMEIQATVPWADTALETLEMTVFPLERQLPVVCRIQ